MSIWSIHSAAIFFGAITGILIVITGTALSLSYTLRRRSRRKYRDEFLAIEQKSTGDAPNPGHEMPDNNALHVDEQGSASDDSDSADEMLDGILEDAMPQLIRLWKYAGMTRDEQICLAFQFGLQGEELSPSEIAQKLHVGKADVLDHQRQGMEKLRELAQRLNLTYARCVPHEDVVPKIGKRYTKEKTQAEAFYSGEHDHIDCPHELSPWKDGCDDGVVFPLRNVANLTWHWYGDTWNLSQPDTPKEKG